MAEKNDVKKRLKADILKLEKKKASYYKKIDEITSRSEAAEQDLFVLKNKVRDEVSDLNRLNFQIDNEMQQIDKINKINDRKLYYNKTVKGQVQFNNQLASKHQLKTNAMQTEMGIVGIASDQSSAEEADPNDVVVDIDYAADPQAIQLLIDVANFRLG